MLLCGTRWDYDLRTSVAAISRRGRCQGNPRATFRYPLLLQKLRLSFSSPQPLP